MLRQSERFIQLWWGPITSANLTISHHGSQTDSFGATCGLPEYQDPLCPRAVRTPATSWPQRSRAPTSTRVSGPRRDRTSGFRSQEPFLGEAPMESSARMHHLGRERYIEPLFPELYRREEACEVVLGVRSRFGILSHHRLSSWSRLELSRIVADLVCDRGGRVTCNVRNSAKLDPWPPVSKSAR